MIPIQDVIPTRSRPVVTMTLIGLNVLVFLLQLSSGARDPTANAALVMFLHSGTAQFFANVLFLWLFGGNVEDQIGRLRFVLLYVICGACAGFAPLVVGLSVPGLPVGASGSIAGIIGAYFFLYPRSRVLTFFPFPMALHEIPAALFLAVWFVVQVGSLAARTTAIDTLESRLAAGLAAQTAAFATGALLCFLFRRPERARVEWWGS